MNDESQLTPPEYTGGPVPDPAATAASAAQRSWWSRWNRWLIGGAAAAVLVGGIGAAALVLVLKPASTIDRMAPASVDVYGVAYLDPSASQKVNLLRVLHRFPDSSTDQKLNDVLDKALKDSGLSYSKDVQPWLSGQLGLLVELPSGSGDPPTAVLIASRDDDKARTTLAKMRSGSEVKNYRWQDKTYDGVTISVGTPSSTTTAPGTTKTPKVAMTAAYALVDHVAVLANSEDLIHQVIDTGRGRGTRLTDSSDFRATMGKLPSDRLGMVYVNGQSIVGKLKAQVGKLATSAATPLWLEGLNVKSLGDADAFRGIGLVLSARQDGVVLDAAMNIDAAKLSNKTNAAMLHPGHPDGVLTWIPKTADGFFAAANLNQTIQAVLDQAGSNASVRQTTDEIGLTGTNGVLGHLTGDYGVEASVDGTFTPTGAVLLGTDNAASMNRFLAGLMALALEAQGAKPATSTSSYRGITITSLNMPSISLQGRFVPSYAVVDGMGIVASRPAELRAIIDAHRTHDTISADATYTAASKASLTHPSGVFYLNLGRVSKLLDSAAGASLGKVDSKTKANLAPLKALMVTGDARNDGLVERFVLLIQ